jgi:hypothetical protein
MVIDKIGNDENGTPIPEQEKLDLSHYPEEFMEF